MCGRAYINPDKEYERLFQEALARHPEYAEKVTCRGDLRPSETALCLGKGKEEVRPGFLRWGYPGYDGRSLINTRVETVREKPLFSHAFANARCALPVSAFYEWDASHRRYLIRGEQDLIWLAGIYDRSTWGFSLLTRASYGGLAPLHPRSPILLTRQEAEDYCAFRMDYDLLSRLTHQQIVARDS